MSNFYKELSKYIKANDSDNANSVVMHELGVALASNKDNFVEIFHNAGIEVTKDMSINELIDAFVENAPNNKKLLLGASYLINHRYKTSGFDGKEEVSEIGVKSTYKVMDDFFSGFVGAIAGAVGEGTKLAGKLSDKKRGGEIALQKASDANSDIIKGVLASRQKAIDDKVKEKENQEKTLRILMYVGGGLLALTIGIVIYKKIKK